MTFFVFLKNGQQSVRTSSRRNRFALNQNARGAHTVFRKDPKTDNMSKHETYIPQTNPRNPNAWESTKRFDGVGSDKHWNKVLKKDMYSPHVHEPGCPGGTRPAQAWEIPN